MDKQEGQQKKQHIEICFPMHKPMVLINGDYIDYDGLIERDFTQLDCLDSESIFRIGLHIGATAEEQSHRDHLKTWTDAYKKLKAEHEQLQEKMAA